MIRFSFGWRAGLLSFLILIVTESAFASERIVYGVSNRIASLNPYLITGIDSFTVLGYTIEPLARILPFTQELKPWLAESWKIDPNSRTVTIKLRNNVKFQSGEPLTAEDVKFTLDSYNDPKYKGEVWRAMWSDITEAKIKDKLTVEFKFKDLRYQAFQNLMTALRILPKSYYKKIDHMAWGSKLIGSGAFTVERFEPNRSLLLKPNRDWWGWKALKLQETEPVTVKPVLDAKLAELMLAKKELDIYQVPSGVRPPAHAQYLRSPFDTGFSLAPNFRNPALQNQRIRKALIQLWNRKSLSEKIFDKKMKLASDSFSQSTPYYPPGRPEPYDRKQAGETMQQLGYTSEKPLTLKVLVGQAGPERWLGMYQTDAAQVGVRIEIEKVADESQWWQMVQQGKFDLLAYDGAFSETPHPSVWHSKGAYNSSGIHDEKLDQWLDQLEHEFNSEKRHRIQRKLILYLREIHAEIPGLVTDQTAFLLSPEVTVDPTRPLDSWHWRKKVQH